MCRNTCHKGKSKKGVFIMNNIGGINGFGNYGVGGYVPQRRGSEEAPQAQDQPVVNNFEANRQMFKLQNSKLSTAISRLGQV